MKKVFTFSNIQAILFLMLSVAETVVMILFKPLPIGMILLVQLAALLCIAEIRFAYGLAYLGNRWHSLWNRRASSEEDDEPSDLAVGLTRTVGYVALILLQLVLFL